MSSGDTASAKVGDLVRWRVVNVSPDDAHTFHLHGHRWCDRGGLAVAGTCPSGSLPVDNVDVFPAQGFSLEYIEDQPGDWMFHCHVADHTVDGTFAFYHVDRSGSQAGELIGCERARSGPVFGAYKRVRSSVG